MSVEQFDHANGKPKPSGLRQEERLTLARRSACESDNTSIACCTAYVVYLPRGKSWAGWSEPKPGVEQMAG